MVISVRAGLKSAVVVGTESDIGVRIAVRSVVNKVTVSDADIFEIISVTFVGIVSFEHEIEFNVVNLNFNFGGAVFIYKSNAEFAPSIVKIFVYLYLGMS